MPADSPKSSLSILDRALYSYPEAARLLRLPTGTLRWWLDGGVRAGVEYPPVIRASPSGSSFVTWGEFVEAGLLRGYRQKRVSLQKMRPFIDEMRLAWGIPYPLAHFKPLVLDNSKLVYEMQKRTQLDEALYLVQSDDDQMLLAPPVRDFLDRVEFDPSGAVNRVFPRGINTPVVIDPEVSFGIPQIKGIRTESVAESVAAGESREQAALSWGLGMGEVEAALAWEGSLRKAS